MKNCFLLLLIACQGYVVLAQDIEKKIPYETKSLANTIIKNVIVKTSGGSISLSGATGQAPRVETYITGNNGHELTKEEIKTRLDKDYDLEVLVSNNEIHVTAKRKHDGVFNWSNNGLSISFKVFVPKQVAAHLSTSGGSIHLENLSGDENFNTSGGSLQIDHLTGMIKGGTSGGSITVSNSGNDIKLETSGGSIHASNCTGTIHLGTSGGSLHMDNLKGTIKAETSGGSIQANSIEGELITGTSGGSINLTKMACSLSASTSGGHVSAELLSVGKYVKFEVSGGGVNLKLPAKQGMDLSLSGSRINKPANLANFKGEWKKNRVKGSFNGGGIPVKVDASGHIELSFN
jgi:hypothetical protein